MGTLKQILVIEDNKEMQEIYRNMFEKHGDKYSLEIVDDAVTALRKVDEKTYDLIILDIIMSPMPGDSFFVYLRESKKQQVPVLVVSVLKPETLENLKEIGRLDILQKPITEDQLFDRLEKMLG